MSIADYILKTTFTKTEALERVREMQEMVVERIFKKKMSKWPEGQRASLTEQLAMSNELAMKNEWNDLIKTFNKDNVYEIFGQAEKEIAAIEPLVLYLAVRLENDQIIKIGEWLREKYGEKFLMEIKFDPNLIAGCALAWKGVYRDYSIRDRFEKKKKDFWEIIKIS